MPKVLTAAQQEDYLEAIVQVTLDNFSMAWRLVDLLINYKESHFPPPTATVHLRGQVRQWTFQAPIAVSLYACHQYGDSRLQAFVRVFRADM